MLLKINRRIKQGEYIEKVIVTNVNTYTQDNLFMTNERPMFIGKRRNT